MVAIKYIVGYTTIAIKNQSFGSMELFNSVQLLTSIASNLQVDED